MKIDKKTIEASNISMIRMNNDKNQLNDKLIQESDNKLNINLYQESSSFKKYFTSKKSKTMKCFSKIFCCFKSSCCRTDNSNQTKLLKSKSRNSSIYQRKLSILKEVIKLNKMDEWEQFKETLSQKEKLKNFRTRIISIFKDDSFYVKIWNMFFSPFVVVVVYLYFLKSIFVDMHLELEHNITSIFTITYYVINIVFAIDCFNSIMRLFTNITNTDRYVNILFIIPFKIFMCIPFDLINKNIVYILFKFFRLDLINTLFQVIKNKTDSIIKEYTHNLKLKIYLVFFNSIFKFLLIFILYAHFIACLNVYINFDEESMLYKLDMKDEINESYYIEFLYYSFTIFTTVGYGDIIPYNILLMLVNMISMIFGVQLFGIILYYFDQLFSKLRELKKEEMYNNFENFISKIENNSGKVMPTFLKDAVYGCYSLKMGISYGRLFMKYGEMFKSCSKILSDNLKEKIFEFVDKEYGIFFKGCTKEFRLSPGKILVEIGERTKKMYFLLYGEVHVFNNSDYKFLSYPSSSMIGDWSFLNNTLSEFRYTVDVNKFAVGFVLDKKSFKEISKKNIASSHEFFKTSYRKIEFLKNMERSYMFGTPIYENEDENNKSISDKYKRNTIANFSNIAVETEKEYSNLTYERITRRHATNITYPSENTDNELLKKYSVYKVGYYINII